MKTTLQKEDITKWSDDDLASALREQVTASRSGAGHDRPLTRAVAAEAARRGWNPQPGTHGKSKSVVSAT